MRRTRQPRLTADRARELLDLDPSTGTLRWRVRPVRRDFERTDRSWNGRYAGKIAGAQHNAGYVRLSVENEQHLAHRVIWLMVYGEWPAVEVDHRDLDRRNNRPSNLRGATSAQNKANSGARRHNRAGLRGVKTIIPGCRYQARICVAGRVTHLGVFGSAEAAHDAYCAAALAAHGQFARAA